MNTRKYGSRYPKWQKKSKARESKKGAVDVKSEKER